MSFDVALASFSRGFGNPTRQRSGDRTPVFPCLRGGFPRERNFKRRQRGGDRTLVFPCSRGGFPRERNLKRRERASGWLAHRSMFERGQGNPSGRRWVFGEIRSVKCEAAILRAIVQSICRLAALLMWRASCYNGSHRRFLPILMVLVARSFDAESLLI